MNENKPQQTTKIESFRWLIGAMKQAEALAQLDQIGEVIGRALLVHDSVYYTFAQINK